MKLALPCPALLCPLSHRRTQQLATGQLPSCPLLLSCVRQVLLRLAAGRCLQVDKSRGGGAALWLLLQPAAAIVASGRRAGRQVGLMKPSVLTAASRQTPLAVVRKRPTAQPPLPLIAVLLGGGSGYLLSKLLRMRPIGLISMAGGTAQQHGAGASAMHPAGGGSDRSALMSRLLRHPAAPRLRSALPLLVSATTFGLAEALGGEPLLTCVATGLVASNWR